MIKGVLIMFYIPRYLLTFSNYVVVNFSASLTTDTLFWQSLYFVFSSSCFYNFSASNAFLHHSVFVLVSPLHNTIASINSLVHGVPLGTSLSDDPKADC